MTCQLFCISLKTVANKTSNCRQATSQAQIVQCTIPTQLKRSNKVLIHWWSQKWSCSITRSTWVCLMYVSDLKPAKKVKMKGKNVSAFKNSYGVTNWNMIPWRDCEVIWILTMCVPIFRISRTHLWLLLNLNSTTLCSWFDAV